MRAFLVASAAALAIVGAAQAAIVKTATVDCKNGQICFYWWPKLPELKRWHGDQSLNFKQCDNGSNILIPDGQSFASAPAVIYARAIFVERYDWQNKIKSTLASFIEDDKTTFRKETKTVDIADSEPLKTGDGQELKTVTYFRPVDKTWECVAYGSEDGYYLMFVVSANTQTAYAEAMPVFRDLIARYKKKF